MHDQFGQLEIVESDLDTQACLALHDEQSIDSDVYTVKAHIKRTWRNLRYLPGEEHACQ